MGSAIDKKEYAVDQVLHQDWSNSKTDTVVITSSLPYTKFRSVEVDGEPLEKANYISTAATGNKTQITLTTQYLQTLANGEHEVVLNGLAEKSTTNINISGNPVKSATGEEEVEPTATSRVKEPTPTEKAEGTDTTGTTQAKQTTAKPAEKKTSSKLPIIIAGGALAAIAAGALVIFKVVLPNKEKNDVAKFKK
jgi:septal ring-binding cell division protein DamX